MDVVAVRYMDVRDVEMVAVRHVDMVAVRHVDMGAVAMRHVDVMAVRNVCMPSAATTSPLCLGLDLLVLRLFEWMIAVVLHISDLMLFEWMIAVLHISDERVDQGFPVDRVRVEGIGGEHKRQCDDQN